ncbi:hypothetical protein HPB50_025022 [Hyalomma asiaticum]|uniref:Uncharacterized protein n=1 Tax=Hyalomma asiaticum TaxID=266040 RepID=A0ACB7TBY1_HYAAI|nr:hypothetical protein HPB50_025022 [Hyalomma asiaticum]
MFAPTRRTSWKRGRGAGRLFGPLMLCEVYPSRGEVWPRPLNKTTGPGVILLNPSTFAFVFFGPTGRCAIADRALKRYRQQLLFNGCAVPGILAGSLRRVPPRDFVGGEPVAGLNSLLVQLRGPCEDMPHQDMDESCELPTDI